MYCHWQETCAVLYEGKGDCGRYKQLAAHLAIPFLSIDPEANLSQFQYLLTWRNDCLTLLDAGNIKAPGLTVDIGHRQGEQKSWPMAKTGALAQALGRKTKTIFDVTAGWGQDSLAMFRMGYDVTSFERSPVMAGMLEDGFRRLAQLEWMRQLNLSPPRLIVGNAIDVLPNMQNKPDCIYLDPMFPPKRKKSALAKKSIMILRDLVGEDNDKPDLIETALEYTGKRVVVKSPGYAEPLGGKPNESFQGKLLRYDVYLK